MDVSRVKAANGNHSQNHYRVTNLLPIILLVVLSVFFGLLYPSFFSGANAFNLLRQMSFLMIVSMGMTFVILMGSIDASVGATATLAGTVAALTVPALGLGALPLGILCGGLVGLLNGAIVIKLKIPSFLATLAMMGAVDGIAALICRSAHVNIDSEPFLRITSGSAVGNMPNISLIPIVIVLIAIFVIRTTPYGRSLYAIGGNERATQYSGIRVRLIQISTFVVAGILAGFAGCLQASMFEAACPLMGETLMMNSIAAVAIGGTQLSGGVGSPIRTVFGVLLMTILGSGMNFMGLEPATEQIVTGIIMIIFVAVNIDRSRLAFVK